MSSTFMDLKAHRAALMDALSGQGLHPVAMEQDSARPGGTVITSSMEKVRAAAAYACVIGRRYGQVPEVPSNPDRLSITELEFREARRLGRPMILFVMGEEHPIRYADVELDAERRVKLDRFREEAKRTEAGADRVYCEFDSLEDFRAAAVQSAAELRRLLDGTGGVDPEPGNGVPRPPALYAEPPYIGSHEFVGRAAQLQTIDDWAAAADPHPVLLFDAIGGTGKSMLTWEWTTRHATAARPGWAGVFWYSFYERGAIMADFCRRALAYMTGRPLADFRRHKQPVLTDLLLQQLRDRPWLLIMDGLERVLVAYHRADAAQLADEDAGTSDEMAWRDPCAAIRPRDDELLTSLAAAGPSKILISSRLIPVSLLNRARQPVPGVRQESLPGLRPADAEALLRSCGVRGQGSRMRAYLQANCDCHPLVTGIVGGLIHDYLPARGDFDAWEADAGNAGRLNLADLDLVGKRNHILRAAVEALPEPDRKVLSMLALLSDAVDYETLGALVPDLDPERLARAVLDLERRGLIQYDRGAGRYDLHPVVRGVASGLLGAGEKESLGRVAVDHFSQRAPGMFESAESIDDLRSIRAAIRVLLQLGRFADAFKEMTGELSNALLYDFEAYAEVLSLLRPMFTPEWDGLAAEIRPLEGFKAAALAGIALANLDQLEQALTLFELELGIEMRLPHWPQGSAGLTNIAALLSRMNRLRDANRIVGLQLDLAEVADAEDAMFLALLWNFGELSMRGRHDEAARVWTTLDASDRPRVRQWYRAGNAEYEHCVWLFRRAALTDARLAAAERLAEQGRNRYNVRRLRSLRGLWHAGRGEWEQAATAFENALVMARESGHADPESEAGLALARLRLGQREAAAEAAPRIRGARESAALTVAELWQALGDNGKAAAYAERGYRWAWADGGDYVRRHDLDRARALLAALGVDPPSLPVRPAGPEFAWERDVRAAIEGLRSREQSGTGRGGSRADRDDRG